MVGDKQIYVPPTISAEAQEALKALIDAKAYAMEFPAPDDLVGWEKVYDAAEARSKDEAETSLAASHASVAEVQMGGYQQLVRGEPMRGKFRNSFETPEPFTPGQVTAVRWTMPDIFHTFRRGHRIMIQVQSTWFPLVDRNPQKFCNINEATEADFQKATQRVYRSPAAASAVKVNILTPAN